MSNPKLWSPARPHLYTARVTFGGDAAEETFGIRTLLFDPHSASKGDEADATVRALCEIPAVLGLRD